MNDTASKTDSNEPQEPVSPPENGAAEETEVVESAEPTLEELLEKARQDAAAAKEAHLRAVADLENFRRRTARERDDLRAFAAANVVEELMPVLDNLGFALAAAKTIDPNLHEAMSQQPSDAVEEGKVLQVIRVGYTLNGRLLRPASVIVSGGPAAAADAQA